MIDIVNEQMIPLSKVPGWCDKHIGHRVNPSTVHRWRLRGVRSNKLETGAGCGNIGIVQPTTQLAPISDTAVGHLL